MNTGRGEIRPAPSLTSTVCMCVCTRVCPCSGRLLGGHWRGSASCGARQGGRGHPDRAPRHSHLLSLAIWVASGRSAARPAAARLSQAQPRPSSPHTPHTRSEATLHSIWAATWAIHRPCVRLRGAHGECVHTGFGCVHTSVTRLQMSPYPSPGGAASAWLGRLGRESAAKTHGAQALGHTRTHTHTLLRVDMAAVPTKGLRAQPGQQVGTWTHARVRAHTPGHIHGNRHACRCAYAHTCPVPQDPALARGLSRAGVGCSAAMGHRPSSLLAFRLCTQRAVLSAAPQHRVPPARGGESI